MSKSELLTVATAKAKNLFASNVTRKEIIGIIQCTFPEIPLPVIKMIVNNAKKNATKKE